jgi:primosomal protein N''
MSEDRWDELRQLQEAYQALRTQPREGQVRMLQWLSDRLAADHAKAMQEREEAARQRIKDSATGEQR